MKSKLFVAASLLCATAAYAQPTAEIYGKVRIYTEIDSSGNTSNVTKQTSNGSWIGFRGNEDLGGGLKAHFAIETLVVADNPAPSSMGDRQSVVGLSKGPGSFELGRTKHAIARLLDEYDPFRNPGVYSSVGSVHSQQGQRLSNGAFATVKTGPVTFRLNHGSSEVAGTPSVVAGGINWQVADVTLGYARYDNRLTNTTDIVAAKYSIKRTGTDLSAMYSDDQQSGVKTTGRSLGVYQKLAGPWAALATYGDNENVKATNLGLDYSLSKRTTINVRYKKEDNTVSARDIQRYGIGIDHNF